MKYHLHIYCLMLFLSCTLSNQATVRLPHFFSDNMVLQRDMPIRIWGTANKGENVSVTFNGNTRSDKADKQGNWQVEFPAIPAGGPYEMKIEGKKNTILLKNILLGDVWICSGQSNMEWILKNTTDAEQEIKNATNPNLRLLTVPKCIQATEQTDIPETQWVECTPKTAPSFSAVGYYFGKFLQQELDIPIGLIHSSWGGTNIQSWTSWEGATQTNQYAPYKGMDIFQASKKANADIAMALSGQLDVGMKKRWYLPKTSTQDWIDYEVPKVWDGELQNIDGIVWFRYDIELPSSAAEKEATLYLGSIDDKDITFVNGKQVGETQSWTINRKYSLPKGTLHSGKNTITVRVWDEMGGGGIIGPKEKMYLDVDGQILSLIGTWKYKKSYTSDMEGFNPPSPNMFASVLYNGMIHPLVGYGIKGAIWYQGENNAGEAYEYRSMFKNMIQDWRKQWGYEFPFYWVQLANFMAVKDEPGESTWAELREAQNMALELPQTGQAVITDIGEADDIHPRNKKDVGYRLAQNAFRTTYAKNVLGWGPVYESMKIEGDKIILSFGNTGKGLTTSDKNRYGYVAGFTIAGEDKKFEWAKAYIVGNTVVVFSEKVQHPVAVRYGWSDNPYDNNLTNSEGLLASPFRTDTWKGITQP